jgi:phosphotransferase system  glucose/maltose/N-acetylglucosamine-specific IIC component
LRIIAKYGTAAVLSALASVITYAIYIVFGDGGATDSIWNIFWVFTNAFILAVAVIFTAMMRDLKEERGKEESGKKNKGYAS